MKRFELFLAFILVPIDLAMIALAFICAYYLRSNMVLSHDFLNIGIYEYLRYVVYLAPIWVGLMAVNGLYNIEEKRGAMRDFSKVFIAASTAILFLIVIIFLTKSLFFSRLVLVFTWVASILFIYFGRIVHRIFKNVMLVYGYGLHRVLIAGNNETTVEFYNQIKRSGPTLGYKVVGLVNGSKQISDEEVKHLGNLSEIKSVISRYHIDDVVLTDTKISQKEMIEIMQICHDKNVRFRYMPDIISLTFSNFRPALFGTMPVMELKEIPLAGWGRIIKRIIDIVLSFTVLIVMFPILLIISVLEKITSDGPIIYSHERVGRDGKTFMLHKFRSMYKDAEKAGRFWTEANDDRITPLGRILRKTNLDELPQLWNILVGQMSFVGPRPEQPRFVEKFSAEVPDYFRRHRVKVGLTGWAQVNGLKGNTSINDRVKYDIYYIENWSLGFDLKILLKTGWLVFREAIFGKTEYSNHT